MQIMINNIVIEFKNVIYGVLQAVCGVGGGKFWELVSSELLI
jgi:hypothetical protein